MKFPHSIGVEGYDEVTVETLDLYSVTVHIVGGEDEMELVLYASESKALRKALKAAEARLIPLNSEGNPL